MYDNEAAANKGTWWGGLDSEQIMGHGGLGSEQIIGHGGLDSEQIMGHGGPDSEPRRIGISRSRRNSPRVIFDEAEIEAEQESTRGGNLHNFPTLLRSRLVLSSAQRPVNRC